MIATIIDLLASRDAGAEKRVKTDREVRTILKQTHERFEKHCSAIPALTQGDSIESLTSSWQPIVFLFHSLLMRGLKFRVGLGTGEIIVHNRNADECDGPAFWNAREALDEIKQMKYMTRAASFRVDKKAQVDENNAVVQSVLILSTLLSLTQTQLQHCFYYIWDNKRVFEIAELVKTTEANVSKSLGRTPCYLLENVLAFMDT